MSQYTFQTLVNDWVVREMFDSLNWHGVFSLDSTRYIKPLQTFYEPTVYIIGWSDFHPNQKDFFTSGSNISVYKVGASNKTDIIPYDFKNGPDKPPTEKSSLYRRLHDHYMRKNNDLHGCLGEHEHPWVAVLNLKTYDDSNRAVKLFAMEQAVLGAVLSLRGEHPRGNLLESASSTNVVKGSLADKHRGNI